MPFSAIKTVSLPIIKNKTTKTLIMFRTGIGK